jgi:hypothetical protein
MAGGRDEFPGAEFGSADRLKAGRFPRNGKTFRDFSTPWKKCFHSVENGAAGEPRS